jgi:hypothetical protein
VALCLAALEGQREAGIGEIIVVDNSVDGTAEYVRTQFPDVEVIDMARPGLVPELWAQGVLRAREEVVALTTAHMVAQPGWAARLLEAYASKEYAGVGGSIVPGAGLGPVALAIYWLRYNRFSGHVPAAAVEDIAGDNGSYRRTALRGYLTSIQREGFWEYEINQQLIANGGVLFRAPEAVVQYTGGESFGRFARQRLEHGRRFGAMRIAPKHGVRRWMTIGLWPATPAVFLLRILRQSFRAGATTRLVPAAPALLYFLFCWSAGELVGYVFGMPRRAENGPTELNSLTFSR